MPDDLKNKIERLATFIEKGLYDREIHLDMVKDALEEAINLDEISDETVEQLKLLKKQYADDKPNHCRE